MLIGEGGRERTMAGAQDHIRAVRSNGIDFAAHGCLQVAVAVQTSDGEEARAVPQSVPDEAIRIFRYARITAFVDCGPHGLT